MIAIRLQGGPSPLSGWANIYDARQLGGWPPPDEIAALVIDGVVAVALLEKVPGDFVKHVVRYRKIAQSIASEPSVEDNFVRGATYEYVQ